MHKTPIYIASIPSAADVAGVSRLVPKPYRKVIIKVSYKP
jgi:hypothetical protein